jgi:hypothetical protein
LNGIERTETVFCAEELPDDANFCSRCGKTQNAAPPEKTPEPAQAEAARKAAAKPADIQAAGDAAAGSSTEKDGSVELFRWFYQKPRRRKGGVFTPEGIKTPS